MRVGCQEPFLDARRPNRVELTYDAASRLSTVKSYANTSPLDAYRVDTSTYGYDAATAIRLLNSNTASASKHMVDNQER